MLMGSVNAPMFIKHLHRQICYGVQRHFQQYFSYIVAVSFIGGGNQSTKGNHQPDYHIKLYRVHLAMTK
jgi:hypothetical protein